MSTTDGGGRSQAMEKQEAGMIHERSKILFEEARKFIPGGVNSPVRGFGSVGGSPLFIRSGQGAHLTDVDGNEYVDFVASWGPLILGHAYPRVIEAVGRVMADGTSFGAPVELELRLAKLICQLVPSVEKVRLVNSGTEATMSAVRLARAFTGRKKILKFEGCYHGHSDAFLAKAGSGVATLGIPGCPGVPEEIVALTLTVPYNGVDAVREAFRREGKDLAAVIVEPVAANMGVVLPRNDFLHVLRELTAAHGSLLIFDEVITGFRLALGGAQAHASIIPDLTTLGKIIGGGLPVGAYGGRADIMDMVAPAGPVYQAGTLSGNPLAVAGGLATLEVLQELEQEEQIYDKLNRLGLYLMEGIQGNLGRLNLRLTVNAIGSMSTLFFTNRLVTDYASACTSDSLRYSKYFWEMLRRGIYLAPSQFEACFISAVHTEEDLDHFLAANYEALKVAFA
jgi:glutamate-1-semialdehyde 2,1-aminomutase